MRLQELALVIPDLLGKLERMKPDILQRMLQDVPVRGGGLGARKRAVMGTAVKWMTLRGAKGVAGREACR